MLEVVGGASSDDSQVGEQGFGHGFRDFQNKCYGELVVREVTVNNYGELVFPRVTRKVYLICGKWCQVGV